MSNKFGIDSKITGEITLSYAFHNSSANTSGAYSAPTIIPVYVAEFDPLAKIESHTQVANYDTVEVNANTDISGVDRYIGQQTEYVISFLSGGTVDIVPEETSGELNITLSVSTDSSEVDISIDPGNTALIPAATQTDAGVMSAADKTKLDGVEDGANLYVHPNGDGNLHVPATGTTSDGYALIAGSTAGSMTWTQLTKNMVGLGNVDNTSDLNKPISNATSTALANKSDVGHSHTNATESSDGFMSAADKTKLDNVSTGDTVIFSAVDVYFDIPGHYPTIQDAVNATAEYFFTDGAEPVIRIGSGSHSSSAPVVFDDFHHSSLSIIAITAATPLVGNEFDGQTGSEFDSVKALPVEQQNEDLWFFAAKSQLINTLNSHWPTFISSASECFIIDRPLNLKISDIAFSYSGTNSYDCFVLSNGANVSFTRCALHGFDTALNTRENVTIHMEDSVVSSSAKDAFSLNYASQLIAPGPLHIWNTKQYCLFAKYHSIIDMDDGSIVNSPLVCDRFVNLQYRSTASLSDFDMRGATSSGVLARYMSVIQMTRMTVADVEATNNRVIDLGQGGVVLLTDVVFDNTVGTLLYEFAVASTTVRRISVINPRAVTYVISLNNICYGFGISVSSPITFSPPSGVLGNNGSQWN